MEQRGSSQRQSEPHVDTANPPVPAAVPIVAIVAHGDDAVAGAASALAAAAQPQLLQVIVDRDPSHHVDDVAAVRDALYADGHDGSLSTRMCRAPAPPSGRGAYRALRMADGYRHWAPIPPRCSPVSNAGHSPLVCVFSPGADPAPHWDETLRAEHERAPGALLCGAVAGGTPAFVRALRFDDAGFLVTETTGLVEVIPDERIPAPLPCTCVLAGSAWKFGKACADASELLGPGCAVELCQVSLTLALAAHRTGAAWELCNRPVAQRCAYAQGESTQHTHPGFRHMAGGRDTLERQMGVDVETRMVYGQGVLGVSLGASVAENLAKTGHVRPHPSD